MDFSELLNEYIEEALSHIQTVDAVLLGLEREGFREELIQTAMRALHTLKGNSGMMGFDSLKEYIHEIETQLKRAVEQRGYERVIEILSDSSHVLRRAIQKIQACPDEPLDFTEDLQRLLGHRAVESSSTVEMSTYLGKRSDTIKVEFSRLDELLNLVGELVIYKTRLTQIETDLKEKVTDKYLVKELKETLDVIGKNISALQEGIMRVRMLPVRHVFQRFPRMVRDLSRAQGKEVELRFEGEETELDKTVIDELGEPLLHLIRNAIDHGIETPQERLKKGKRPKARLVLSAAQESNHVLIRVIDDGRGIDPEMVRARAIERGLLSADSPISEEDILSFIFAPGFSTKEQATDISGRGVGLDVVSRSIARLNGHVYVESTPDVGTTFTIKLPLSLAIIPALMAEVGNEIYAIPMNAVEETVKVKDTDFNYINNREVVRFRERVLPVVRLDRFFGVKRRSNGRFYLVILSKAERRVAVTVDRVRGQQEIVIKPLDETVGKSIGIVGASILGDGRIVLIVDVSTFFERKEVVHG